MGPTAAENTAARRRTHLILRHWIANTSFLSAFIVIVVAPYLIASTGPQADTIRATDDFLNNHGISLALLVLGLAVASYAVFKMLPLLADESRRRAEAWDRIAKAHESLPTLHALTHERLAVLSKNVDELVDELRRKT